jgi:hypothetical protein
MVTMRRSMANSHTFDFNAPSFFGPLLRFFAMGMP